MKTVKQYILTAETLENIRVVLNTMQKKQSGLNDIKSLESNSEWIKDILEGLEEDNPYWEEISLCFVLLEERIGYIKETERFFEKIRKDKYESIKKYLTPDNLEAK